MEYLREAKTCDLVNELEKRLGVERIQADPYEVKNIKVEGPAQILIITD